MFTKIGSALSSFAVFLLCIAMYSCGETGEDTQLPSAEGTSYQQKIPAEISFNYHVKPILSDRCYACHGPDRARIEAGLSLSNQADAFMALGDKKDHYAIVPGNLEESTLIARIYTDDATIMMPPPESNLVLNDYEREILKRWVEQGANYESHWSFRPVSEPTVPTVSKKAFIKNEIDHFILKKLEGVNETPAEEAQKELLIRRLSFDLTGLPPSMADITAFIKDSTDTAYEKIVDQYLSSTAYAENMTALWMDVARYADTHGYQDDLERTMWPWRDWVIHAFQQNMPYDQFIKWQLAGDLLPEATKEQIIATGFNRNHKITQEGGVIPEEYRVEYVSDRAMTFGKAFLGLSVECAKCHDHKYDPISQKDYYSLFSFFNNIQEVGLIEEYGQTPAPFITLTKADMAEQLTFIKNLDTLEQIELMVMEENTSTRPTFVLGRGAYDNPLEEVFPSTPASVLPFDGYERNRKGLAEWLFNKQNPLTSRVMVNRLWMMCFGRGLVSTPDDFGAQGALPTHPELLDHLAYKFMKEGWDVKSILKEIVLSATYRQSSKATVVQIEKDPENRYYARGDRIRLSAEKIRDHVLASSGLLVQKIGGPSVKPYQPNGLWQEVAGGGGITSIYKIDKGEKQYRRSLYTFWKRTVPPPDMVTFDAVTRDFCMVNRETTSTPLQALVMMNSPQIIEGARNLAYRAIKESEDLEQRINFMYQAATSRQPQAVQINRLKAYFEAEKEQFELQIEHAKAFLAIGDSEQEFLLPMPELAAYAMLATAIYNLDESITRS